MFVFILARALLKKKQPPFQISLPDLIRSFILLKCCFCPSYHCSRAENGHSGRGREQSQWPHGVVQLLLPWQLLPQHCLWDQAPLDGRHCCSTLWDGKRTRRLDHVWRLEFVWLMLEMDSMMASVSVARCLEEFFRKRAVICSLLRWRPCTCWKSLLRGQIVGFLKGHRDHLDCNLSYLESLLLITACSKQIHSSKTFRLASVIGVTTEFRLYVLM